jgi:hypothetical protein
MDRKIQSSAVSGGTVIPDQPTVSGAEIAELEPEEIEEPTESGGPVIPDEVIQALLDKVIEEWLDEQERDRRELPPERIVFWNARSAEALKRERIRRARGIRKIDTPYYGDDVIYFIACRGIDRDSGRHRRAPRRAPIRRRGSRRTAASRAPPGDDPDEPPLARSRPARPGSWLCDEEAAS